MATKKKNSDELPIMMAFRDKLPSPYADVVAPVDKCAETMATKLPASSDLTQGLRKLIEARNAFLQAAHRREAARVAAKKKSA